MKNNPLTKGQLADFAHRSLWGLKQETFGSSEQFLAGARGKHAGETCFILGNGPSLKGVDNEDLQRFPSFGTNGIFLKFIPTYFVTISLDFYKNHVDEIRNLSCRRKFVGDNLSDIITSSEGESALTCSWNMYGTTRGFNYPVPFRFSKNAAKVVYLGGSVLFVCLQLAYWMGFSRVILLGVDHSFGFPRSGARYGGRRLEPTNEDNIHFDKAYSKPGYNPHCDMIATERSFELALKAFQKDGREILNATEGTDLDVIPKAELKDII
jgi:hypothetical protein